MLILFLSFLITISLGQTCNYAKYTTSNVVTFLPVGVCVATVVGSSSRKSECHETGGVKYVTKTLYTGNSNCDSSTATTSVQYAIFAEGTTQQQMDTTLAAAGISASIKLTGDIECVTNVGGCGMNFILSTYNQGTCTGTPFSQPISYTVGHCQGGVTLPITQQTLSTYQTLYCPTMNKDAIPFCQLTSVTDTTTFSISMSYTCDSTSYSINTHLGCSDCNCDYLSVRQVISDICVCVGMTCYQYELECPTPNTKIGTGMAIEVQTTSANGEKSTQTYSAGNVVSCLVSVFVVIACILIV